VNQYPGIYEARVVTVSGTTVAALIPQLFRDQQVTITKWIGHIPSNNDLGYVSFIGGDAAWPVWLGLDSQVARASRPGIIFNFLDRLSRAEKPSDIRNAVGKLVNEVVTFVLDEAAGNAYEQQFLASAPMVVPDDYDGNSKVSQLIVSLVRELSQLVLNY
jgi:hypothetical protein